MRKRFQTLSDFFDDLWSADWPWGRLIFGGIFVTILLLITFPRFIVPFLLLVIGVAVYLRYSRPKDSL